MSSSDENTKLSIINNVLKWDSGDGFDQLIEYCVQDVESQSHVFANGVYSGIKYS